MSRARGVDDPGAAGPRKRTLKERLGRAYLVVWLPVTVGVTSLLMVNHLVAMPDPGDLERVRRGALAYRGDADGFSFVHVIYEDCSCTKSLVSHLVARGPHAGAVESVLFIGSDPPTTDRLAAAGYRIDHLSRDGLHEHFGLEAAPLLLILDRRERLVYAGGYYETPATVQPRDRQIYAKLLRQEAHPALPLYGCAVSQRLRDRVDPLGLQD